MSGLARVSLFWVGLALAVLGGGNWITGRIKLSEYDRPVTQESSAARRSSLAGYPELTRRTNAALLHPLRSALASRSFAEAKRDFYQVVLTGGRLLTLLGLFLTIAGLLRGRRQQRAAPLSPHGERTRG